ncbi:HTH psq-type domain-containing protein [Aphis craccivora]|uniref:HTH psq-type domain-containing protein n=1 Tax=Aphis craccivora TaxID=307492 RepID=A0A6G0W7Z9_APHCR|nr:HTH psq-type domain-containing protein [Aphis craccivora]
MSQISSLWRETAVALAIHLLWTSKQRSGVAVNMMLRELEGRREHSGNVVVIVADHKTGDKEPASLVLG